jgi:hypothetical protein
MHVLPQDCFSGIMNLGKITIHTVIGHYKGKKTKEIKGM